MKIRLNYFSFLEFFVLNLNPQSQKIRENYKFTNNHYNNVQIQIGRR